MTKRERPANHAKKIPEKKIIGLIRVIRGQACFALSYLCYPRNPWFSQVLSTINHQLPFSFLIRWHLGQDRWLQHPLFFFPGRIEPPSTGRDEARGHEDKQIRLDVLIDIGPEAATDEGAGVKHARWDFDIF